MAIRIDGTNTTANPGITGADADTGLQFGTNELKLVTGGTEAVKIDSNQKLTASQGILFGTDTADANTLDDYEEGTWTPTYIAASSNPTVTYTVQEGSYTKVGDIVTARCKLQVNTASGGSGNLRISGLPFTTLGNAGFGGSVGFFNSWTNNQRPAFCSASNVSINLYRENTGQSTAMSPSHLASNCNLTVTVTYKTS